MYALCDPEVVSSDCYDAALVSDSSYRVVGFVSTPSPCFPVRDYLPKTCLCVCAFDYSLLVRDFDASAVCLACEEECPVKGEEEV